MDNLFPLIGGLGFLGLIIGPAVLFEAWTESRERRRKKRLDKQLAAIRKQRAIEARKKQAKEDAA